MRPIAERFEDENPQIRFILLASDENDRLQDFGEAELACICGAERAEIGADLIRLFPEAVDPVCAPEDAARFGAAAGPADLVRAALTELRRRRRSAEAISRRPPVRADGLRLHAPEAGIPEPRFVTDSCGACLPRPRPRRGGAGRGARLPVAPLDPGRWYFLRVDPGARDFIERVRAEAAAPAPAG